MRITKETEQDIFDSPIWIALLLLVAISNIAIGIYRFNFISIFNFLIGTLIIYSALIRLIRILTKNKKSDSYSNKYKGGRKDENRKRRQRLRK